MPQGDVLEFSGVTKRFGSVTAVDNFTATVQPGVVTGFLGPNGAGKSTTLRILLGLVRATEGEATIGGVRYDKLRRPTQAVGAVLEATSFHPNRTARNHLEVYALAGGIHKERVGEVLSLVGLTSAADRRVGGFSLGMRQRVALATALLGDPPVLILDEPTNGLDPEGIQWMRTFLRAMAAEGRTVLVSSHMLSEVQQTVDSLLVIASGRKVFQGGFDDLLAGEEDVTVVDAPDRSALAAALQRGGFAFEVLRSGLTIRNTDPAAIGAAAAAAGVALSALQRRGASLEEVFLQLVSGTRRPAPSTAQITAVPGTVSFDATAPTPPSADADRGEQDGVPATAPSPSDDDATAHAESQPVLVPSATTTGGIVVAAAALREPARTPAPDVAGAADGDDVPAQDASGLLSGDPAPDEADGAEVTAALGADDALGEAETPFDTEQGQQHDVGAPADEHAPEHAPRPDDSAQVAAAAEAASAADEDDAAGHEQTLHDAAADATYADEAAAPADHSEDGSGPLETPADTDQANADDEQPRDPSEDRSGTDDSQQGAHGASATASPDRPAGTAPDARPWWMPAEMSFPLSDDVPASPFSAPAPDETTAAAEDVPATLDAPADGGDDASAGSRFSSTAPGPVSAEDPAATPWWLPTAPNLGDSTAAAVGGASDETPADGAGEPTDARPIFRTPAGGGQAFGTGNPDHAWAPPASDEQHKPWTPPAAPVHGEQHGSQTFEVAATGEIAVIPAQDAPADAGPFVVDTSGTATGPICVLNNDAEGQLAPESSHGEPAQALGDDAGTTADEKGEER